MRKSSTTRPEARPRPPRDALVRVALGLGCNQGDCEATLRWAIARLARNLEQLRVGPLLRGPAISPHPQPAVYNTALVGRTALDPAALLGLGKRLELAAGRHRGRRWGPRPLDVDLLLYGERQLGDPELTVPHPRLRQRRFALEPLAALAPDWPVPPDGRTLASLLAALSPDQPPLERLAWTAPLPGAS